MGSSQQQQGWRGRNIASQKDVFEALQFLNLPIPSEQVVSLIAAGSGRVKFKNALEACLRVDGSEPTKESKHYLVGLVNSVSPATMDKVTKLLGYKNVPIEAFIIVGQEEGTTFYRAVQAAVTATDPQHDEADSVVEEKLRYAVEKLGQTLERSHPRVGSEPRTASVQKPGSASDPSRAGDEERVIPNAEEGTGDEYYSTHAYAGNAALCFNASRTPKQHFAVSVDAAQSVGERKYDWKNAIKLQLNHKELPLLYGVLVGWRNKAKFDAHGAGNDKSFEIERQDGKLFAKVVAKGQSLRAVPIGPMDAYQIMNVVLSQIIKEAPDEIRKHPDLIVNQMRAAQNIKPVAS